jgi:hypothetical protein
MLPPLTSHTLAGAALLAFFKTSAYTRCWFLAAAPAY